MLRLILFTAKSVDAIIQAPALVNKRTEILTNNNYKKTSWYLTLTSQVE